jgi:hypothetical protein
MATISISEETVTSGGSVVGAAVVAGWYGLVDVVVGDVVVVARWGEVSAAVLAGAAITSASARSSAQAPSPTSPTSAMAVAPA